MLPNLSALRRACGACGGPVLDNLLSDQTLKAQDDEGLVEEVAALASSKQIEKKRLVLAKLDKLLKQRPESAAVIRSKAMLQMQLATSQKEVAEARELIRRAWAAAAKSREVDEAAAAKPREDGEELPFSRAYIPHTSDPVLRDHEDEVHAKAQRASPGEQVARGEGT